MLLRLLLLAALFPLPALALDATDADTCRNGLFPAEQHDVTLAKVTGSGRLYLLGDTGGCPARGEPVCRQRSYVVGGDTLLTGRTRGGYVCAFYPNKVGGSAGWVDAQRLQALKVDTAPALQAWAGQWRNGGDQLDLRVSGSQLQVRGAAYWPSATPTPARPYGPNLGQIDATARPRGSQVHFADADDDSCTLQARLLGDYLLVADNGACGGMNVRFNGVYQRARPTP